MKNTSIIERIEYAAQNGVYEIPLYVWNKTAKKLRKEGFVLTETKIKKVRKGEGHYMISWKNGYHTTNPEMDLKELLQETVMTVVSSLPETVNSWETLLKKYSEIDNKLCVKVFREKISKYNIELTEANRMWLIAAANQK